MVRCDVIMLNMAMEKLDIESAILSLKVAFSEEDSKAINAGFKEIEIEKKRLIKGFEDCTL